MFSQSSSVFQKENFQTITATTVGGNHSPVFTNVSANVFNKSWITLHHVGTNNKSCKIQKSTFRFLNKCDYTLNWTLHLVSVTVGVKPGVACCSSVCWALLCNLALSLWVKGWLTLIGWTRQAANFTSAVHTPLDFCVNKAPKGWCSLMSSEVEFSIFSPHVSSL